MRPLTALLGILMGSAVALATGLLMTWIVILFLPAEQARFAPEHAALMRAIAVFTLFSAASAGSFYGELRERSEEHTSELQSQSNLVCRLLLEKKKKKLKRAIVL